MINCIHKLSRHTEQGSMIGGSSGNDSDPSESGPATTSVLKPGFNLFIISSLSIVDEYHLFIYVKCKQGSSHCCSLWRSHAQQAPVWCEHPTKEQKPIIDHHTAVELPVLENKPTLNHFWTNVEWWMVFVSIGLSVHMMIII